MKIDDWYVDPKYVKAYKTGIQTFSDHENIKIILDGGSVETLHVRDTDNNRQKLAAAIGSGSGNPSEW